jgi:hypothetical protein
MNEAPKKIWIDPDYLQDETDCVSTVKVLHRDVEYIRADLVDGLVEALKLSAFHMHKITTARGKADYSVVRAALKALETNNE